MILLERLLLLHQSEPLIYYQVRFCFHCCFLSLVLCISKNLYDFYIKQSQENVKLSSRQPHRNSPVFYLNANELIYGQSQQNVFVRLFSIICVPSIFLYDIIHIVELKLSVFVGSIVTTVFVSVTWCIHIDINIYHCSICHSWSNLKSLH